jgi:hypothetical protein
MAPVVEVRELRKSYGDTVAVQDVSPIVQRGEIFGIIGPSPGLVTRLDLRNPGVVLIPLRLIHQDVTRTVGRRDSGRGGTGCFAMLGPQGVDQPFKVRHGHGERRVATSAKR